GLRGRREDEGAGGAGGCAEEQERDQQRERRAATGHGRYFTPRTTTGTLHPDDDHAAARHPDEVGGREPEDRARVACGRPDLLPLHEVLVDQRRDRLCVADGRHAADREPGAGAHERGVGLRDRLGEQLADLHLVHPVRAARQSRSCPRCSRSWSTTWVAYWASVTGPK